MKIMHLSDIHLGKRISEYSMIEDQRYILIQILSRVDEHKPDAIFIAGDVYDKSVPSDEAFSLFDWFLTELHKRELDVFVSSGNHDSVDKVSYASNILAKLRVYMSPKYDGNIIPITLIDEYGKLNVYMLPFIKPIDVRSALNRTNIESYTDAVRAAIEQMKINKTERNMLLCHQFITGAQTSESEIQSVGGLDNVDASVFEDFDYVALGHIHKPQWIVKNKIRYCGTPLKYSFSEVNNENSITLIDIKEKGNIDFTFILLKPKRQMREVKGKFADICKAEFETEDYVRVILTDEEPILDAQSKLYKVYKNMMKLDFDNSRTRENREIKEIENVEAKNPFDIMSDLYTMINNQELSSGQADYLKKLITDIWGDAE